MSKQATIFLRHGVRYMSYWWHQEGQLAKIAPI